MADVLLANTLLMSDDEKLQGEAKKFYVNNLILISLTCGELQQALWDKLSGILPMQKYYMEMLAPQSTVMTHDDAHFSFMIGELHHFYEEFGKDATIPKIVSGYEKGLREWKTYTCHKMKTGELDKNRKASFLYQTDEYDCDHH